MPDVSLLGHTRPYQTIRILFSLTIVMLLTACVTERSTAPTTEPEPTATPQPSATSQPSPTAEPTSTPTPEPTPTPAQTATPEPTATPVPEPTPTPEPTPEPKAREAPYPIDCTDLEPTFDADLQRIVYSRLDGYVEGFGVVIQELTTGARAEINPDQSYYAASLYKAAVLYEAMRQVEAGALSLEQYVTIDEFYASQDLGTLDSFGWGPGSQITLYQALEASIIASDNATAYLLGDLVGWYQIDDTLHEIGAGNTHLSLETLPTTAGDMGLLLESIACARGVSDDNSQLMLDFLAGQYVNNRLPLYLPDEAVIGHKTGNWDDANHDTGIVYGPDAVYVISVMSYYPGADERIALLSRDVYEHFHPNADVVDDDDEHPR